MGKDVLKKYKYICPQCGKTFYNVVANEWVYKKTDKKRNYRYNYFCSYNCFNKAVIK